MLNISHNTINARLQEEAFKSFKKVSLSSANIMFKRWLIGTLFFIIVLLFLPWTQNIQSKGKVTTLRPEQRPQTIHSTIAGRIEKWYVREGQLVQKGDTIVFLSEIKDDYFDPDLVVRTTDQVRAKEGTIQAYDSKIQALENQIVALSSELDFKQQQLRNKIRQARFKITSDSIELVRSELEDSVAVVQLQRTQQLFEEGGIKSRADVEDKRVKRQQTSAKVIEALNKLEVSRQELINAKLQLNTTLYETNQKVAKAESDKFSTLSNKFDAEGGINKLRIQSTNYERRTTFRHIVAPQDCYITKAIKPGLGETVKEGDPIVSIVPADYQLAVELFVSPMDLPLVNPGQEVRFIFDGWPAFIFSGWPGQSFGTYSGEVVAIDNMISDNGKYRILVGPESEGKVWPIELRPGSGAQGIALLNNVPLWYEIWRQLNGFPPDFYEQESSKDLKLKAPVKSIK